MTVVLVLVTAALVVAVALLAATTAGVLARLDGATLPATVRHAAAVFTAVLTLACAIIATVTEVVR